MTPETLHLSDCSLPESGLCDCGGLTSNLAGYAAHAFVATFVASTGRFGFFVGDPSTGCFIEAEQLPANAFVAYAAAADLPDAHNIMAILGDPYRVDFDETREAVISKFKAHTLAQGITSYRLPHSQ